MKILTDWAWQYTLETLVELRQRVKDLEKQNAGLIDRLLIEKGQIPLDENLGAELKEATKTQEELFETLTQEEIGEYTPDVEPSSAAETE